MYRFFLLIASSLLFLSALPLPATAGVELPPSPLSGPITLSDKNEFELDDFDEENKPDATGETTAGSKISKTKAVIFSLLIPGAGQYYAGRPGRGQVFMAAEIASWLGYFAFRTYGKWKEDDYKNYAVRYAGIRPAGQDEEFFRNLIFYDSREEYNTSGRIINPGAPYYQDSPEYDWHWENTETRSEYRSIRNTSETSFRKATFMLGVAVFNRIISGIDAFRVAKSSAERQKDRDFLARNNIDIALKANPFGDNPKFGMTVTHRF